MSINPEEIHDRIKTLIPASVGTALFPESSLDHSVEAALLWHSNLVSRSALYLGTPDGTTARFSLPDDFVRARQIESPYGETPSTYLDATEWEIHRGTAGLELLFDSKPGSGDVFGVHYDGTWSLSSLGDSSKIPLAYLACAFLAMREAARMAEIIEPVIEADVVNYGGQARAWLQIKDHFIGLYARVNGLSVRTVQQGAPAPAFGIGIVPSHQRFDRWWWDTS